MEIYQPGQQVSRASTTIFNQEEEDVVKLSTVDKRLAMVMRLTINIF